MPARMREGRLAGKTAIITGVARGIGAAIVRRFAQEDAALAILDLNEAEGDALARELAGIAEAALWRCDVTEK